MGDFASITTITLGRAKRSLFYFLLGIIEGSLININIDMVLIMMVPPLPPYHIYDMHKF